MTPQDLADRCAVAADLGVDVLLELPPPRRLGGTVRLAGRAGPLGTVLCLNMDGNVAAVFRPRAVLRYLAREGYAPTAPTRPPR